jgi:hypothetical protein
MWPVIERRLLLVQRRASQAGTEPESCCWMAADAGSPVEPLLHGLLTPRSPRATAPSCRQASVMNTQPPRLSLFTI